MTLHELDIPYRLFNFLRNTPGLVSISLGDVLCFIGCTTVSLSSRNKLVLLSFDYLVTSVCLNQMSNV